MAENSSVKKENKPKQDNKEFFAFLGKFKWGIVIVVILSLGVNLLTLLIPRVTSRALNQATPDQEAIQAYVVENPEVAQRFQEGDTSVIDVNDFIDYDESEIILLFGGLATAIFILGLAQVILASKVSEDVAADLRSKFVDKVSTQSFQYIQDFTVQKLLTNLTSDVDAVKAFISQGIVIVFASVVLLIGSALSLLTINWKLAIPVLLTVPALFVVFGIIFSRISKYFTKSQEVIDKLNLVINETIVGAALIRVLSSRKNEESKFEKVNSEAVSIGYKIVNGFAILVPVIGFALNVAVLIVVGYGGRQVIEETLNVGDFAAFFTYVGTFIMPVIMLGFLGTVFTRAFASFNRIQEVLNAKVTDTRGNVEQEIKGEIQFKDVSLELGNRSILEKIDFSIKPGTRTAIIGPTAAGKTQLFYLLSGLLRPNTGFVTIDGTSVTDYKAESLYSQLGLVFQDSIIFNTSIGENVVFSEHADEKQLKKALDTSELWDYVQALPDKEKTKITERGTSLSGGQKQRLTLARALSVNPKILLLDDFTARVDIKTEKRIFKNLEEKYPDTTLISITQKIEPVKDFDKVILIMEGELIAQGTHEELLKKSFEYQQIYESQKSTEE